MIDNEDRNGIVEATDVGTGIAGQHPGAEL